MYYLGLDEGSVDPKPVSCGNRSMALFSSASGSSPDATAPDRKLMVVGFGTTSASPEIEQPLQFISRRKFSIFLGKRRSSVALTVNLKTR